MSKLTNGRQIEQEEDEKMTTGQTSLGTFAIDVTADGNGTYKATLSHNGSYRCSIRNATLAELGSALSEEVRKAEELKEAWYGEER